MISRPHGLPPPTGKETHMLLHCEDCGWRSEVTRGLGMRPVCPQCREHRLKFIKFDASELAKVNGMLGPKAEPVAAKEVL